MHSLNELREKGEIAWIEPAHGWIAEPDVIVKALFQDGFEECKLEVVRSRRYRDPFGGVWQGLNQRTGSVASAVWVNRADTERAVVFIDIDGQPLEGQPEPTASRAR